MTRIYFFSPRLSAWPSSAADSGVFGEHCLSGEVDVHLGASCAADGVGEPHRASGRPRRGEYGFGPFAETKGP